MEEKIIEGGVCAAKGFKASGVYCGIKAHGFHDGNESPISGSKNDIALVVSDVCCNAAGVYTKNKVKGAPVTVTRDNLIANGGKARAIIVNSGNANTCNADGEEKARRMAALVSDKLGIAANEVIVASTGVIGQVLPIEPIEKAIDPLFEKLSYNGNIEAATAIMTTDTVKKEIAAEFEVGGKKCVIGGMAKGSGMIHPNMATMLCFITTDCAVSSEMLREVLGEVTKVTFNRVSIDGDTSTNDMCMLLADGLAGNSEITEKDDDYYKFKSALYTVMRTLSREIARDGEGATKLLECVCSGAETEDIAEKVAKSVITSSLFKAAMFGADANWGRILCAMGYSDAEFDITKSDVDLGSEKGRIAVCRNGAGVPFSEEEAKTILLEDEIKIFINLNSGDKEAIAWGCDLTYDYVKINGDYRS